MQITALLLVAALPFWQDMQATSVNAETRRTEVIYFASREDALSKGFRESENYKSLNGTWDFKYFEDHRGMEVPADWDKIPAFIEKMVEYNALAYDHNAQAGFNPRATAPYWGYGLRSYSSWRDAVEDMLDFYRERISWLDTHIGTLKAQRFNPETAAYEDLPQQ